MKIGIYIYPQAEVLDFSGPFEVFSTACRLCSDVSVMEPPVLIGATGDLVTARGNFAVQPHFGLDNHPKLDVLIVPGGIHTEEMQKPNVLEWIKVQAEQAQLVASVCTGVFLLAQAGVLTQQSSSVTTHWEDIPDLQAQFPHLTVQSGVRWVDQGGKFVTSAGISAGIDMSLHLVSRLHSMELAKATAKQMEFDWTGNVPADSTTAAAAAAAAAAAENSHT